MSSEQTNSNISRKPVPLPWGLSNVAVLAQEEIIRPVGYALPGEKALSVTLSAEGRSAIGYGEGEEGIAYKRAYSEALERLALFSLCARTGSKESSNGWAAHTSASLAIEAAIFELIERDVALTSWENGGPFYVLPESLWPQVLKDWKRGVSRRSEYHELQILLSETQNGSCVSALLFNGRGNFVAGHGSSRELGNAILSAAHECFRAAHSALRFEYLAEVLTLHQGSNSERSFEPGAHSLAYAYRETLPAEVRIEPVSAEQALAMWARHQNSFDHLDRSALDVTLIDAGSHVVARVKSPRYRQIFWGPCQDISKRNIRPHFVG